MSHDSQSLVRVMAAVTILGAVAACRPTTAPQSGAQPAPNARPIQMPPLASLSVHRVVPAPVSVTPGTGAPFVFTATTTIAAASAGDAGRAGEALGALLRTATGFRLPVYATDGPVPNGAIVLRLGGAPELGPEGYDLTSSPHSM